MSQIFSRIHVLSYAIIITVVAILAIFMLSHESANQALDNKTSSDLAQCLGKISNGNSSIITNSDALAICYNTQLSIVRIEEEYLVRDAFVFQRGQSVVLITMVVVITLSGVVLAALQLLGSYRLALRMKGNGTAGSGDFVQQSTTIEASTDKLVVRSATVGIAILAISFAFFFILVRDVYTMQKVDIGHGEPPPQMGPAHSQANQSPSEEQAPKYTMKPAP